MWQIDVNNVQVIVIWLHQIDVHTLKCIDCGVVTGHICRAPYISIANCIIWFDLIWFIAIRNHQIYNRVNQMNLIGWFPAENRLIFYALSHNMPFLHNSVLLFNATRNCLTWTWFLQTINVSAFRNKCRKIRWPEPDGHTTLNINI